MKIYNTVLIAMAAFLTLAAQPEAQAQENCPVSVNEPSPCQFETQEVKTALLNLNTIEGGVEEKLYSYCLSTTTNPGFTGLQCRTLTMFFKKSDGSLIKDIFIDRFVGHEARRIVTWSTYLVKDTETSYKRFRDHHNDGVLKVDIFALSATNVAPTGVFTSDAAVPVSFNGNFPTFTAYYFNDSLELAVSSSVAVLKIPLAGLELNYVQINSESTGTYETDEEWAAFRTKEGIL